MKKIYNLFMGLAAFTIAPGLSAQELVIPTHHGNENIEIIGTGKFDIERYMISNTQASTVISLGEVDFGTDGEKYKAASVDFANAWGDDERIFVLSAGDDLESAVPFAQISLFKTGSYFLPCRFGTNITEGQSENVTVDDAPVNFVKPAGVKKVFLTMYQGNGNLYAVNFHENELNDVDFANGNPANSRLLYPNEHPAYDMDKCVVVLSVDSEKVSGPEGAKINPDSNAWGWTGEGLVVDYGTFDFGDDRYDQVVVYVNRWSEDKNSNLKFYIDDAENEDNFIGELWAAPCGMGGDWNYIATNIKPVSGTHNLLVKWDGAVDVKSVGVYEDYNWCGRYAYGRLPEMIDDLPVEDAFRHTFEGSQIVEDTDNKVADGNPWRCEILREGRWESNNVGYTKNGTVLKLTMPDGEGIDFGENLYGSIVVNHACPVEWLDFINNANFEFYTDLEDWENIGDAEPFARVRIQGTGGWGTRKHVRGEFLKEVSGQHVVYMVYNIKTSDTGANVFDIYLEPRVEEPVVPEVPAPATPSLTVETNHNNMDFVEIIGDGRFDVEHLLIGNTTVNTVIGIGQIDFADGEKYKAASVDFANSDSTDGSILLCAGNDLESAQPFAQIGINEYNGNFYHPRRFGANMGYLTGEVDTPEAVAEEETAEEETAVEFIKPEGVQKVYLKFVGGRGNIFAVHFYETELTEHDFVKDGQGDWGGDTGIRLLWPSEDPRFEDKHVVILSTEAVAAVEGYDAHINPDTNAWGWTADGFVADFGDVDFGENRYNQAVAHVQRWDKNNNTYIEFYIDEVNDDNLVARMWAGREARNHFYPVVGELAEVSGTHKLLVKWAGNSFDLYSVSLYEGNPWSLTTDYNNPPEPVDELPAEEALHYTVEGTSNGQGGIWNCEILNKGQFEGNGNVGYTGNGTVLKYTSPDGSGIDFGTDIFKSIVVNHACDKAWTDFIHNSNFTFYIDLDDWNNLEDAEPIATVRLQGTGNWGTRKHVRGDITREVNGKHDLYLVYNTPTTDAGANIFDIYMEYKEGMSGVEDVMKGEGVEIYADAKGIVVDTEAETGVTVYNVSGMMVVNTVVTPGNHTFAVAPGFYLVKTATATVKVIVK